MYLVVRITPPFSFYLRTDPRSLFGSVGCTASKSLSKVMTNRQIEDKDKDKKKKTNKSERTEAQKD